VGSSFDVWKDVLTKIRIGRRLKKRNLEEIPVYEREYVYYKSSKRMSCQLLTTYTDNNNHTALEVPGSLRATCRIAVVGKEVQD